MENKFRVWCTNKKEWEQNECFLSENGDIYQFERGLLTPMRKETHLPSYYTGLKDKNGVEIYEGDIVVSQWGDKQPKEIRQGEYLCYTEDGLDWMNGFYWHVGFDDDSQSDIGCEFSRDINGNTDKFEIKGNIHQNPELLK